MSNEWTLGPLKRWETVQVPSGSYKCCTTFPEQLNTFGTQNYWGEGEIHDEQNSIFKIKTGSTGPVRVMDGITLALLSAQVQTVNEALGRERPGLCHLVGPCV